MKVYLDTSALLKLYHEEENSDSVFSLVQGDVEAIMLSEIAVLEFRSALWKKVRMKELTEKVAAGVIACFGTDIEKYEWVSIDSEIVASAAEMLMRYGAEGLRTLDSIQLASALMLKGESCIFVTADSLLRGFMKAEGLSVAE